MRIELARLEHHAGKFSHQYAPGELSLEDDRVVLVGPARVSGLIKRGDNQVLVDGEFSVVVQIECDRCLKPVELQISNDFRLEYVTAQTYQALEAAELAQEDLALSIFDGEFIDVDDLVREQVLLAVPTHAICQEQCMGFCPVCGANKNITDCNCNATEIDPRWSGLKDLRF
jgi:uncharacterized protein